MSIKSSEVAGRSEVKSIVSVACKAAGGARGVLTAADDAKLVPASGL